MCHVIFNGKKYRPEKTNVNPFSYGQDDIDRGTYGNLSAVILEDGGILYARVYHLNSQNPTLYRLYDYELVRHPLN